MTGEESEISCPYVGLVPFSVERRAYFFGRERDIQVTAANLDAAPLTIFYGASGVGKSSVLLAGVVPWFDEKPTAVVFHSKWLPSVPLPGALIAACRTAIEAKTKAPLVVEDALPFDEWLLEARKQSRIRVALIFDQFEEYFLYHAPSDDADSFDAQFARAVNRSDVPASFMISMREDSLSMLDRFRARIPNLLSNLLRLEAMNEAAARDAIRKPLAVWNDARHESIAIEDELVSLVIDAVRGGVPLGAATGRGEGVASGPRPIEAPFLQLVMERLWSEERKAGSSVLRADTLKAMGGADAIVRRHLDDVMETLTPRQQEACARVFDRLVTPSGSKVACTMRDLQSWAEEYGEDVEGAVTKLVLGDVRLLRKSDSSSGEKSMASVEIFHDVLGAAVLSWCARFEQEKERLRVAQEAAGKRRKWRIRFGALALVLLVVAAVFGYTAYQKVVVANQMANNAVTVAEQAIQVARSGESTDAQTSKIELAESELLQAVRTTPDQTAPGPAVGSRVYVQIQCAAQRETAKRVEKELQRAGFVVPGIELLQVGPRSTTELRYFLRDDANLAERARHVLEEGRVAAVSVKYLPGYEDFKKMRPGHLELWFARDLGCPAPAAPE